VKRVRLRWEELEEFQDVQINPRADWLATFSCNNCRELWPYVTPGVTLECQREYLQRKLPRLSEIVKIILEERPGGGHFFIDRRGVFMGPEGSPVQQVAKLEIS
jgi:hypothetical protein